MGSTG
ncbi:unnamed protein product [Linum tenue]